MGTIATAEPGMVPMQPNKARGKNIRRKFSSRLLHASTRS